MLANGIPVKVKLDTGANVTVFLKAYIKTLKVKIIEKMGPARGPDGNLIEMEGRSWIEFECGEREE
uniref:Putative LOC102080201 [Oreochromis niloticus] n=1 Tax=Lepeophtheirus salmonis TaxID=72036 RepID=A0A0K2UKF9_LEPSM